MNTQTKLSAVWAFSSGTTLLLLLIILLPGRTFNTTHIVDLMVFLDGADRILEGQVPNRDFHSAMGPLGFYLPALGLWLGGSFGAMMPMATAIFALFLFPLSLLASTSRLPLSYALAFNLYIALLVISPLNPGEPPFLVSFAAYYNRWGWALLGVLFIMALPRRQGGSDVVDAVIIGLLVGAMIYLKASYAAVGGVLLVLLATVAHARPAAIRAVLVLVFIVIVAEALWGQSLSYIHDVRSAARASGALRNNVAGLVGEFLVNLPAIALFLAVLVLAKLRGLPLGVLVLCAFVAGAGFLLMLQNAHRPSMTEIASLVPAALVATLYPSKVDDKGTHTRWAAGLLLAALMLPSMAAYAVALAYHAKSASKLPPDADPNYWFANIDGLITRQTGQSPDSAETFRQPYRDGSADISTLNTIRGGDYQEPVGQSEYMLTIKDGVSLLGRDSRLSGKVFVFDMANPFPALLDRAPAKGVHAWNHADRTFSAQVHLPPEMLFADIDVVMIPKNPWNGLTYNGLMSLYGGYLGSHFQLVNSSDYWLALKRSTPQTSPS